MNWGDYNESEKFEELRSVGLFSAFSLNLVRGGCWWYAGHLRLVNLIPLEKIVWISVMKNLVDFVRFKFYSWASLWQIFVGGKLCMSIYHI